jgi:hypothetical protein
VCALATVLCLFACFNGATSLFSDTDAGWHIRNGEAIIANHALPVTDTFSFSKSGEPWIAWEWGSDVVMGAIHRLAGLDGVAAFFGLAIGAAVWMWFRLNWAAGGSFPLAALLAIPMISTTSIHWLARPHVLGWLFLLATVWYCEKLVDATSVAFVFVASAIWANLHGSFILGPIVFLIYAAGAYIAQTLWGLHRNPKPYLIGAAAALAGSLINPCGPRLHYRIFTYLTDSALLHRIGEYQSFDFHSAGAPWVVASLLIGVIGGAAALTARRPERFLLTILMTTAALISARSLPLAALTLLPLANGSITEVLSLARGLQPKLRHQLDQALIYSDRLKSFDSTVNGLALIPVAAILLFAGIHNHAAFPPKEIPVAAAERIPSNARIFSTDKFGGYLIYRFPTRQVFFDGRSDFYGANFIDRYARMFEARPHWREEFARWHFTHALIPPDAPLVSALLTDGWRELYRDHTSILLEHAQ